MSYVPAIIEWGFWLLPYALLLGVVMIGWPHITGLRGEQIRSICVFAQVFVLGFSLRRFDEDRLPWEDPMWLLAIVAMVTIALISWGAQNAKLKFAQYELEMNRSAEPPVVTNDPRPLPRNMPGPEFGMEDWEEGTP